MFLYFNTRIFKVLYIIKEFNINNYIIIQNYLMKSNSEMKIKMIDCKR